MCALMYYQIALFKESLIAHITSIRTLTTMYALMCYKTALFSECLIAHFTCIWPLTPMYITGIFAFITLYMKLFIQSTLGKTQRLSIRIYCGRKNCYLYGNV